MRDHDEAGPAPSAEADKGDAREARFGDFIIEIDGSREAITENRWLELLYHDKVRGDRISLLVIHDGKRKRLQLKAP